MIENADFLKHFHKLMKNALCAKKEIVRKRKNHDLIDEAGT